MKVFELNNNQTAPMTESEMSESCKEFIFIPTCCGHEKNHNVECKYYGIRLDFETYYSKFKATFYKDGGCGGLPSTYVPKDLETYLMLLERLCIDNDNDVTFFLTLVSFFTGDHKQEHIASTAAKNVQRLQEISVMKARVGQMFSDHIDTLLKGKFYLSYNSYADYIDPVILLEKIIRFRLAELLCKVLNEMCDDVNNKDIMIDIPSFSDLKILVPKKISQILGDDSNNPKDATAFASAFASAFADAVVVRAAHSGYVKVIDIMSGVIDTQLIVCREIEAMLSDPEVKFYDSYAGGMLPIAKTITPEGKRKISKWEYMVSAIRNGQMRRVQFMLECFPFEDVDNFVRDEITKIKIIINEFGHPDYRYTDIYELLYHEKFKTDLKNHNWDQADVFLKDYEKYFGQKYRSVINCDTAFHWYLKEQDFEVFKYLVRSGMEIEFSIIYCGFRNMLRNLLSNVYKQLHDDPSDPAPYKFAKTLLPQLNFYAKMLFHCFNPEVKLKAETKIVYVMVEGDVEEKDEEKKDGESSESSESSEHSESSESSDKSSGKTKKVKKIRKRIEQPFCREPFEEARDLLWHLIEPISLGKEITLVDLPSWQGAFDMRQDLMAIHKKYFRWE